MTPDLVRARLARSGLIRAGAAVVLPALVLAGATLSLTTAGAEEAKPGAAAAVPPAGTAGLGTFSPEQKKAIEDIIKEYLVANPEVFLEVQSAVEAKMEKIQAEKLKTAITDNAKDIFHHPNAAVAGNPKGDITVVEFFDYNCGYCKRSYPDIAKLVAADPKIRVVFKELPILAKASEEAAKVALAARMQGKYWEVHRAIFETRGAVNEASALKAAEKVPGIDMGKLKADMNSSEVMAELNANKALAAKMGINGTPHFLVGDHSIPGAPENLLQQIESTATELRKTGCSVC